MAVQGEDRGNAHGWVSWLILVGVASWVLNKTHRLWVMLQEGRKKLPRINENVVLPDWGSCENEDLGIEKRLSTAGVLSLSPLLWDSLLKTSPHGRSHKSTKSLLGEEGRNLRYNSKSPGFNYCNIPWPQQAMIHSVSQSWDCEILKKKFNPWAQVRLSDVKLL